MADTASARIAETHISYVFLLGDRAYKLKKPVRFDFIDLSTRQARKEICEREVELNRRLAPDTYLGVLDVCDADGRPVDHLVEMVRMPDERRLSAIVAAKEDPSSCLRRLARLLADFHASAATSAEIAGAARPPAVHRLWTENLDAMRAFEGEVLDPQTLARIRERVDRYIDGRHRLFDARVDGGHIRDGHGDLLADDIFCMDDGPRVLDCIEFDDRLRWTDVLADVAFLAMDLERLGAPELAASLLASYRGFSSESYPATLADHYIAYRASIRSKVACIKHAQDGDEDSARSARELLGLCDRRLASARIRLVLVGGLPGTGKSTLADGISGATGWALLHSDEIRKDLAGIAHTSSAADAFGHGIYDDATTKRTYAEMVARARALLEMGTSVVLDASWSSRALRDAARAMADDTSSDVVELRCEVEASVAAERIGRRRSTRRNASDADAEVAAAMAAEVDAWPQARRISTADDPGHVLREALDALGA